MSDSLAILFPPSLEGVYAKLDRAQEHIDTLNAEFQRFNDFNPYVFRTERESDGRSYVVWGHLTRRPPIKWSVVIGEIAHDARSALDHLVFQLARLNSTTEIPKGTQFPLFTEEREFQRRGRKMVRLLLPRHAAAIRRLQPYKSAFAKFDLLSILSELNNTDKHNLLNVTIVVSGLSEMRVRMPNDRFTRYSLEILHNGIMEIEEAQIARITFPGGGLTPSQVNVYPEATSKVNFADTDLFQGGVSGILQTVLNRCRRVVGIFDSQFT